MFVDDPKNPFNEIIQLENGNEKIIRYHYKNGDSGLKLEASCMTVEIYDEFGNLLSKVSEKNPYKIY